MRKTSQFFERYRQSQKKVWEYFYQLGKKRFILLYGILFWGGIMFAAMTFLEIRRDHNPLSGIWNIAWLGVQFCLYCIGGYIFGLLMWRHIEHEVLSSRKR
jgi:hypothetical protein